MRTVKELGIDLQHDESLNYFAASESKQTQQEDLFDEYNNDDNKDDDFIH